MTESLFRGHADDGVITGADLVPGEPGTMVFAPSIGEEFGSADLRTVDAETIRAFLAQPLGPRTTRTQLMSWFLRARHEGGRFALFEIEHRCRWRAVRVPERRGDPLLELAEFSDLEEAERFITACRWWVRTGQSLQASEVSV